MSASVGIDPDLEFSISYSVPLDEFFELEEKYEAALKRIDQLETDHAGQEAYVTFLEDKLSRR